MNYSVKAASKYRSPELGNKSGPEPIGPGHGTKTTCGFFRSRPTHVLIGAVRGLLGILSAALIFAGTVFAQASNEPNAIVVNGVALSADTVRALQQIYPVAIEPGRYWYDAVSGAYGREGEPIAGQMIAGLVLGGPLQADASRGTAGVFINGRQITSGEKAYIEQLCQTPVALGRYWILFNGLGGYEGGPAMFDLGQCPGLARPSGGARSMSKTYCDNSGNCTSTGVLGYISTTAR